MARINFEVEDSLHKAIKSVALSHNKSIKEYILTFIDKFNQNQNLNLDRA